MALESMLLFLRTPYRMLFCASNHEIVTSSRTPFSFSWLWSVTNNELVMGYRYGLKKDSSSYRRHITIFCIPTSRKRKTVSHLIALLEEAVLAKRPCWKDGPTGGQQGRSGGRRWAGRSSDSRTGISFSFFSFLLFFENFLGAGSFSLTLYFRE